SGASGTSARPASRHALSSGTWISQRTPRAAPRATNPRPGTAGGQGAVPCAAPLRSGARRGPRSRASSGEPESAGLMESRSSASARAALAAAALSLSPSRSNPEARKRAGGASETRARSTSAPRASRSNSVGPGPVQRAGRSALTAAIQAPTIARFFPPARGKLRPAPKATGEFDMTFTEAAVEVLRRAAKPLHYAEIAEAAVRDNLLSHVGQDPEVTMGQRLAAMAKREDERRVVAVSPEGTFALLEWSVPAEQIVEPVAPPLQPAEDPAEPLYRAREREPRPIHAQARRRLEALQPGPEESEEEKRRERPRKFPPPAEVAFEWLAQRQSGAPIAELSTALFKKGLLSDALVRDAPSLVQALLEDNRRRTEAGRKPAFIV